MWNQINPAYDKTLGTAEAGQRGRTGKVEGLILEEGLTSSDPAYSNFHTILKEVEEAVNQELKRRKPQRDRPILQASKKRFIQPGTDVTPIPENI